LYGLPPREPGELVVFLFSYPSAPLIDLVRAMSVSPRPVRCLIPVGRSADICTQAQQQCHDIDLNGNLRLNVVPFVDQVRFDQILAACDVVFVRGEDSFVLAQRLVRPFIWQIYPQQDGVHQKKLDAFLALYTDGLDAATAKAVRGLWDAWNSAPAAPTLEIAWPDFIAHLETVSSHARSWDRKLAALGDFAANLEEFIAERL
jgi:uncharacterized repeat protein (TIGR03837 family)